MYFPRQQQQRRRIPPPNKKECKVHLLGKAPARSILIAPCHINCRSHQIYERKRERKEIAQRIKKQSSSLLMEKP